jgi:hypothetical protein
VTFQLLSGPAVLNGEPATAPTDVGQHRGQGQPIGQRPVAASRGGSPRPYDLRQATTPADLSGSRAQERMDRSSIEIRAPSGIPGTVRFGPDLKDDCGRPGHGAGTPATRAIRRLPGFRRGGQVGYWRSQSRTALYLRGLFSTIPEPGPGENHRAGFGSANAGHRRGVQHRPDQLVRGRRRRRAAPGSLGGCPNNSWT